MNKLKRFVGVTTAFATIGLAASCTPSSGEDLNSSKITAEVTASTAPEAPKCVDSSDARAIGLFAVSALEATEAQPSIDVNEFIESYSDLKPAQLVEQYMIESATLNTSLVFDEGILEEDWDPYLNIFSGEQEPQKQTDTMIGFQKQILVKKVDNLLRAFAEYPPEFLASLGINTIRVADNFENYAGQFDIDSNEVIIEFDVFSGGEESLQTLREYISHEVLGHGTHEKICDGNVFNDTALSSYNNGFEYIGEYSDEATGEDIENHYSQIPSNLLDIGPDRTFVEGYGATNSAEDFATIVEWTTERRGLVMPEDADYGSPLAQKQERIGERIEQLLPGYKAFCEQRTRILRRNPDNEINIHNSRLIDIPDEITSNAKEYSTENWDEMYDRTDYVTVINGGVYESSRFGARNGSISLYPRVTVGPSGKIYSIISSDSSSSSEGGLRPSFFQGDLDGGDVVKIPWEEYESIKIGFNITSPEADMFFASGERTLVTSGT